MRIKISAKLYSISGLAMFGLGLVTIMSAYVINRQNNAVEQMAQGDVAKINDALGAKISLAEAVRAYKNYLIRKDWKQVAIFREQLVKLEKQLSHFEKLPTATRKDVRLQKPLMNWENTGGQSTSW